MVQQFELPDALYLVADVRGMLLKRFQITFPGLSAKVLHTSLPG